MVESLYSNAPYHIAASAGNKKWVSATAVADKGNSQAMLLAPARKDFINIAVIAGVIMNRSGSTVVLGLAVRYRTENWIAGTITAAGVFTDATAAAQNATANDFTMHNGADSGSGFIIGATHPFNILGIIEGTAGDQTGPTTIIEYWNGTAWVNIASSAFINDSINTGTGEKILCWPMPLDWARGGSGTGVDATKYNIRVRQTNSGAGTTNPLASQIFVGFAATIAIGVVTASSVSLLRDNDLMFDAGTVGGTPLPVPGDALFPVFSVASASNYVEMDCRFY
jgi:hypothetical protein